MNSTFYCFCLLSLLTQNLVDSNGCLNGNCYEEGARVDKKSYSPIDPCVNFYKFSCKNWISKTEKPSYEILWNHWHEASHNVNAKLRRILEQNSQDTQSLKTAQSMYFACLNATKSDRTDELVLLISAMGGWFHSKTNGKIATEYRWPRKVAQMTRFAKIYPLLKMHVEVDTENPSKHILYIDPGELVMPTYILEHAETHIQELLWYKEWIIDTVKLMYPAETVPTNLNEDVDDLIAFEIQLAKLVSADSKRKFVKVGELIDETNGIDWLNVFKIFFDGTDVALGRNNSVAVSLSFLRNLIELLRRTKPITISNYVIWHLVKELSRDASPELRRLNFRINSAILGIDEDYPRNYECAMKVGEYFQFTLAARYVELYLPPKILSEVKRIATEIKSEFVATLKRNKWLSRAIVKRSIEKIAAVKIWIGYPKWVTNTKATEQLYKNIKATDNHFLNVLHLRERLARYTLQKVQYPATNRWPSNLFDVNGYYNPLQNSIIISLGLLEKPFFNPENPSALNYGALGSLIGHEFSHALDEFGKELLAKEQKDKLNHRWWTKSDIINYRSRVNCLKEHYDSYNIDGQQTMAENIADNVGLELSFRAYRRSRKLNRLDDQQFFISYAQMWCEILGSNDEFLNGQEHAPVQVRVQGAIRNSFYFYQAFGCDLNAKIEKCSLW
ncbi:hypothetical protein Trydic_g19834 [Trypoxylus dichotomus]